VSFHQEIIPVLSTLVPIGVIAIGKFMDKGERKSKKINDEINEVIEFVRNNKGKIEELFKRTDKLDEDVRECEKEISRLSGRINSK
jgi:predicted  nucleic acid-binding Zn-ribbon protein